MLLSQKELVRKQDNILTMSLPLNNTVIFYRQQLHATSSAQWLPGLQKGLISIEKS